MQDPAYYAGSNTYGSGFILRFTACAATAGTVFEEFDATRGAMLYCVVCPCGAMLFCVVCPCGAMLYCVVCP